MANGFAKAWNYLSAWFSDKVDEKADPKIQIQQAIGEAQRQHEALTRQAATVIGNQHQLELKLDRQLAQIEELQAQAKQALVLSDQARSAGDEAKAVEYEETAAMLAGQLVSAESAAGDLKQLHDQSLGAAQQARQAVEDNAGMLQQKLAERTKLLSQLEQAKMQEQVSASLQQMSELAAPKNTPSLEAVRDKIERRYSVALGQADLASGSVAGRLREVKKATASLAGQARLDEIRASMSASGAAAKPPPPSLTKGGREIGSATPPGASAAMPEADHSGQADPAGAGGS
jgi:phage shock protein A